jgi:hypothetical protein
MWYRYDSSACSDHLDIFCVGPQKYSTRLAVPISISKRVTLLGKVQDIFRHESGKKNKERGIKRRKWSKE